MSSTYEKQQQGLGGSLTIAATVLAAGDFCEVLCIGATAFTTLTDSLEKTTLEYGNYASGTITFTDAPHAEDTITVHDVVYTFKAEAVPANAEITIGTGDDAAAMAASTAANVAAKLAGDTAIVATPAAGVVTVRSAVRGTVGNGATFTLVQSANHTAVSGALLTGGTDLTARKTPTYPAGTILRGRFTAVQPAAASVTCYISPDPR